MAQDFYQETGSNVPESSLGLFDKIILAIREEKESRQTRNLLCIFIFLFIISLVLLPFSFHFFIYQWQSSGASYFISTAAGNLNVPFDVWQDYILSILESLPVMAIVALAVNISLLLFTIRLFLYKKGMLLKYLKHTAI